MTNEEVARVLDIHFGTVSNCNPFFLETGFLARSKLQNIPCDEVFAYAERFEWDQEKAAFKLAPVIRRSWFYTVLAPKLSFRPLTVEDVIKFLAEESGAAPEYKDQLSMLIDFMRVAGIVTVENGVVALNRAANEDDSVAAEVSVQQVAAPSPPPIATRVSQERSADSSQRHPFIDGLLKTLPDPGEEWSIPGRVKWLQAASNIFGLIYTTKDGDDIEFIDIERKQL